MKLVEQCGLTINQRQIDAITSIDNWDFDAVKRLVQKEAAVKYTEDQLERGICSLKQYYTLAVLDSQNFHAIAVPLDPFWHSHILFTENYERFCNVVAGHYMHHLPLNLNHQESVSLADEMYIYTCKTLETIYGYIDPEYFPREKMQAICFHYASPLMLSETPHFPRQVHLTSGFNNLANY